MNVHDFTSHQWEILTTLQNSNVPSDVCYQYNAFVQNSKLFAVSSGPQKVLVEYDNDKNLWSLLNIMPGFVKEDEIIIFGLSLEFIVLAEYNCIPSKRTCQVYAINFGNALSLKDWIGLAF